MTFPPPAPTGALHDVPPAATAAILIIGNEILSGKTQDANTPWIAAKLKARGIRLQEVRVVADTTPAIVEAVNALRKKYGFVFTTGGIGPTHDDITAESIAAAFDLPHVVHAEARSMMEANYARRGVEMNAARLRMATMPEGATLILPAHSSAPGFKIGNVFVMAGIPAVMHDMWTHAESFLPQSAAFETRNVTCALKEGDLADALTAIQKDFPDVEIGSYPVMGIDGFSVTLALTSDDPHRLDAATAAVEEMVRRMGG